MIISKLKNTAFYRYLKHRKNVRKFKTFSAIDKQRMDFYSQFMQPGDLVFDVGANLGNRTKIFLKLGAKVVGFEPQKLCADFLKGVLKDEDNFTLIESALGSEVSETEMFVSEKHTLSTLSEQWVNSTHQSGRFTQSEWSEKQIVQVTTLDRMIEKYGAPAFIKIDVEGYEFEVISGLSSPVKYMSIEFASENIDVTYQCIEHMSSLAEMVFQYSEGESMKFTLTDWVSKDDIKQFLHDETMRKKLAFGDVYIKIKELRK